MKRLVFVAAAIIIAVMFSTAGCVSKDGNSRPTVGPNLGIASEKKSISASNQKYLCGENCSLIKSYENRIGRVDVCDDKIFSYEKIDGSGSEEKWSEKIEHSLENVFVRMQVSDSSRKKFIVSMSFVDIETGWSFIYSLMHDDGDLENREIAHGNLVVNLICGAYKTLDQRCAPSS